MKICKRLGNRPVPFPVAIQSWFLWFRSPQGIKGAVQYDQLWNTGIWKDLKKCPGCRSISPDDERTCGVCGEDLERVAPMTETLDQSIEEDMAEESAGERRFSRKARKANTVKLFVGLLIGLAVLAPGIILISYDGFGSWEYLALGFLCLPAGLLILASVALGGLGPSAWYRLWDYRVFRIWWTWIGSEESEEERKKEANQKAENTEARNEDDTSKRDREKSTFD
jgi:hypothetical protein